MLTYVSKPVKPVKRKSARAKIVRKATLSVSRARYKSRTKPASTTRPRSVSKPKFVSHVQARSGGSSAMKSLTHRTFLRMLKGGLLGAGTGVFKEATKNTFDAGVRKAQALLSTHPEVDTLHLVRSNNNKQPAGDRYLRSAGLGAFTGAAGGALTSAGEGFRLVAPGVSSKLSTLFT